MVKKTFKSLDEQIEILSNKGLIITDHNKTKDILLRENYFFINGYRSPFLKTGSKMFNEGTTFDELYSLFTFDRFFRNIIFKNILIVENNYKSILSYIMSKKYGYKEKDYMNNHNFDGRRVKQKQINDLLRKIKRQIRINGSQHSATSHYMNNYGYIPLWVSVKVLSFGIVGELYSVLKQDDREELASYYNNIDCETFENYLIILSNYRNLCAHEDILYNHKTTRELPNTIYHELLSIPKLNDEYIYGLHDIFALIIILKHFLTRDDFKMMMNEINYEVDKLSSKINSISINKILNKMGFPENYRDIVEYD